MRDRIHLSPPEQQMTKGTVDTQADRQTDRIHLSPPEQHMTKGTVDTQADRQTHRQTDRQTDSAFRIIWFTVAYKFNPELPDIHVYRSVSALLHRLCTLTF